MAETLAVANPAAGLDLPLEHGAARCAARPLGQLVSVAPFRGRGGAVAAALADRLGTGLSDPGHWAAAGSVRVLWFGFGLWLVEGGPEDLAAAISDAAAVTDQSDGWAGLRLEGAATIDVLARLVPLDLDAGAFPHGRIARTLLRHVPCALLRDGEAFEILVPRSFVATAYHDLAGAMAAVAARALLGAP